MGYVLKWTISLNCATYVISSSWISVSSQEEEKNQPLGAGLGVGHLGAKPRERASVSPCCAARCPCFGLPQLPADACVGMTQEKRDSVSPGGRSLVPAEGECVGACGEEGEGVGQGDFLPLSVECGLQGAPCSDSSDSHLRFAVGDEVWLCGWVVLRASSQGVTGPRLGHAQLPLVAVSLPPQRLLVGVPALKVGGGVVGQGVGGHLVGSGLLSVLLGGTVLGAEGPGLILHSDGVQR